MSTSRWLAEQEQDLLCHLEDSLRNGDFDMIEHVTEDCQCKGKKCTKCDEVKCIGAFGSKRGKLRTECRFCNNKQSRAYYATHKEQHRQTIRTHNNLDREQYLQDRRKAYQRTKTTWQAYRLAHLDDISQYYKEWRKDNQEARKRCEIARRTRKTQAGGSYTLQEWEDLKTHYEYRCLRCFRQEPEVKLTVDHVVPVTKNGTSFIENIQPLCLRCNAIKGTQIIDYRRDYHVRFAIYRSEKRAI